VEQLNNRSAATARLVTELRGLSVTVRSDYQQLKTLLETVAATHQSIENQSGRVVEMLAAGDCLNLSILDDQYEKAFTAVNQTFSHIIDRLDALTGQIGDLLHLKTTLEEVSYSIRNVSLLMKIKSSKLVKSEFDHVVIGLEGLARQMKENTEQINLSAVTAIDSITTLKENLHQRLTTFNRQFSRSRQQIRQLLDIISRVQHEISQQNQHLHRNAAQNEPRIGSMVSTLQFHDISLQQIDDVCHTLEVVNRRLSSHPNNDGENDNTVWLAATLKLQKNQVDSIIVSVGEGAANFGLFYSPAVETVNEQAVAAKIIINQLAVVRQKTTVIDQDFAALSNLLSFTEDKTRELLAAISGINHNILEVSRQVAQIEVSRNDLEALTYNAVFKAAKVGSRGKVMGTITDEITALSREVHAKIADKENVIRSIVTSSKEFEQTLTETLKTQQRISANSSQEIQSNNDRFEADCQVIDQAATATRPLQNAFRQIAGRLAFDQVIVETLRRVSLQLQDMLDDVTRSLTEEQKQTAFSDEYMENLIRQFEPT
jgi:hypothetical protein